MVPTSPSAIPAQLRQSSAWLWQLAALALIWGSSFLLIKVALDDFGPLQVALGRIALGAVTLLAVLAITRTRMPRDTRAWLQGAGIGLLMNAAPFSLFAWGETRLGSVEAGIWNATTPLFVLLVLVSLPGGEHLTRRRIAGLLLGFAGVLVVLEPWAGLGGGALAGHAAFAGAAACYGLGTPWMKRAYTGRPEGAVALSAVQLTCATGWMLLATLPTEGLPSTMPTLVPTLCVVALGVVGTGIAYILYTTLVRAVGAAAASSVTYLMPVVSTALGVVVLGEALGWNEPVGTAIILLGVAATTVTARARRD